MQTRDVKQVFVRRQTPAESGWVTDRQPYKVSAVGENGYELQDYTGHRTSHGYYSRVNGEHTLDVPVFGRIHPDDLVELQSEDWEPNPPWPEVKE